MGPTTTEKLKTTKLMMKKGFIGATVLSIMETLLKIKLMEKDFKKV